MRAALLILLLIASPGSVIADDWMALPGNPAFVSVLEYADSGGKLAVAPFEMMARPVTNAQFLAFVVSHPQWRRGNVPALFAEARYLEHWRAALDLGDDVRGRQPVTRVSWFAASAYCEATGGRLPTWSEWEYAAAADADRDDARADPAWRERILAWYAKPSNVALAEVGRSAADLHGIHDLHGLIWEWVEDFNAILVSADNRQQSDPDLMQFCGAGAISTNDREHYAVLMRIAMLSALEADDTTGNLGFRCVRAPRPTPRGAGK